MMSTTRLVAALAGAAVATTAAALPAAADNDRIAQAANATLRATDIPASLGTAQAHSFTADHKTGALPWLCSVGENTLSGTKAPRSYQSSYLMDKQGRRGMVQAVFVYRDTATAKAAWKDLVKKIKKCTGTSQVGNWQQPGGSKVTQTLRNGKTDEKYDGTSGWWLMTDITSTSAADAWTTDEITVYYRVGSAISLLDYDQLPDAKPSVKQRELIEDVGMTLDQRWQAVME